MFKNPTVAEKFTPKVADIKINMKGYHGMLSSITPLAAKQLAERNSHYLEAKPEVKAGKKNAEPGGN
jgi:hypothetical protein